MLRSALRTVSAFAFLALSTLASAGCAVGLGEELNFGTGGHPGSGHTIATGTGLPTLTTVSASSSSSSGTGHSSSTSSSGGGACDSTNDCQTCSDCGIAGMCQPAMNACETDQSCSALITCLSGCADQTCADGCAAQNPGGQQAYMAMVTCVLCQACPVSCAGQSVGACGP